LLYFLSQFLNLFLGIFVPVLRSNPVFFGILFTFIFSLSKIAGGIFFGIAFWSIARAVKSDNIVVDYLAMSAYGIVLLFVSNQAVVLVTVPYPPFGVITTTFIVLSSYLMLRGIYSSAISVSHDMALRQSMRKVLSESKLLDGIGTAEVQNEIERKIMKVTRARQVEMEEETGVRSSLDEDEIKKYLDEVIRETRGKST
jgi:hypothetical protein